jgi:GH25 family lysozyme M1 (1,4-beta-N-acetylmuramidase)
VTPNVIDIYHGDTITDFAALKAAGVLGVIHKATQGANIADPAYAERRQAALAAGLLWGAYTFNTGQDVQAQVDEFFSHANPDASTLMALDFEDNPASNMSIDQAIQFLKIADLKLGRKLVLYSGNRVKDILGTHADAFLGSHRLWLPQYGPTPHAQASWVTPWLWQYSETGRLPGTAGNLDLNLYSGPNLAAEWSGAPPAQAAPASPSLLSEIESKL